MHIEYDIFLYCNLIFIFIVYCISFTMLNYDPKTIQFFTKLSYM